MAAATDAKGSIYAIGGVLVRTQILKIGREIIATVFNTVEVYSPTTQSWSNAPPMPTARWGLAAATDKQENIYAIGGTINQDLVSNSAGLNTVERYTPPVTIYTFIKN